MDILVQSYFRYSLKCFGLTGKRRAVSIVMADLQKDFILDAYFVGFKSSWSASIKIKFQVGPGWTSSCSCITLRPIDITCHVLLQKTFARFLGSKTWTSSLCPKKTLGTWLKTQMTQFTSNPIVICFSVDIKAVLRYRRTDNQAIYFFLSLYSWRSLRTTGNSNFLMYME